MNTSPDRPPLRAASPAAVLAVIPYMLGFTPEASLVVVGASHPSGRLEFALRYDLPDPPDRALSAEIAAHATAVMAAHRTTRAVVAGYGPGALVTPVADALRQAAAGTGLELHDVLRVEDGRYWSYLCHDPSCCPVGGVAFDAANHPIASALAATGSRVLPKRTALEATIAPVTGAQADVMREATRRAERAASRLVRTRGEGGLDGPGLAAVRAAIQVYRDGGSITPATGHAWLALVLTRLRIRDDAWARMDPAQCDAHGRLWSDLVRRAQPGYVAAPASLLAVASWQRGDGALANIALDRALADSPGYSMALLLKEALYAGAPPSMAVPPMTPEQVAASYANPGSGDRGESGSGRDPAAETADGG